MKQPSTRDPRPAQVPSPSVSRVGRTMLDNGKDYLERSVGAYRDGDYKFAVIFLWSALMLFMKVRLFRVNPVLIYAGLDHVIDYDPTTHQPRYAAFDATGDRKTVDFAEVQKRLQTLSIDSVVLRSIAPLNELRRMRNRIEHYVDDVRDVEYLSALDSVLPFLTSFVEGELCEPLPNLISNWDELLQIDAFYKDRLARMNQELSRREYLEATDGDELHSHKCPHCRGGIMTDVDGQLACAACGFASEYTTCRQCGRCVLSSQFSTFFRETHVCDDCFEEGIRRNP